MVLFQSTCIVYEPGSNFENVFILIVAQPEEKVHQFF